MIKVEFYVHAAEDGSRLIEFGDMSLTHVSGESLSAKNDMRLIFDALHDGLQHLYPEAWYTAEVERRTDMSDYQMDEYFIVMEYEVIEDNDPFNGIHYNSDDLNEMGL